MTALSHLNLSHFRSYKTARIDVDGRPVAISGPNGAGKTNILEAISLLSPGRGLRRAAAADMARRPEGLGWKIAARFDDHEVETRFEPGSARTVTLDGKSQTQTALGRLIRVLWLVPAMDRLWTEGADGRRRFIDRVAMSFTPDHAGAVLAYEKAMRERNRLLKDHSGDLGWYMALEGQMGQAGAQIIANRQAAVERLNATQDPDATLFPAADLAMDPGEGDAGDLPLAEALAEGRGQDMRAGRTLTGPHRADLTAVYAAKGVAARECSTGEQKALLISLVLANARALEADTGTPPILLLDEVAAHLDADRRGALYAQITALGAQAWMTGTGVELFAELGEDAQTLTVQDTDGISQIGQIS